MLVSLAMICSCEKKDSTAQQQLAQRKVELDTREEELAERKNALDEREKVLDEREKALADKQKGTMNAPPNPTDVQDPAQVQAEANMLELQTQHQLGADELEKLRQRKLEATGVSPTPQ